MQEADSQDVGEPDAAAVHDSGIWVHFAVSCAHIHLSGTAALEQSTEQQRCVKDNMQYAMPKNIINLLSSISVRQ